MLTSTSVPPAGRRLAMSWPPSAAARALVAELRDQPAPLSGDHGKVLSDAIVQIAGDSGSLRIDHRVLASTARPSMLAEGHRDQETVDDNPQRVRRGYPVRCNHWHGDVL